VHCQQGVSRSSAMAIAYLMWKRGTTYPQTHEVRTEVPPIWLRSGLMLFGLTVRCVTSLPTCLTPLVQEVKQRRPVSNPNAGFAYQLMNWSKRRTSPVDVARMYEVIRHSAADPTFVPKLLKAPLSAYLRTQYAERLMLSWSNALTLGLRLFWRHRTHSLCGRAPARLQSACKLLCSLCRSSSATKLPRSRWCRLRRAMNRTSSGSSWAASEDPSWRTSSLCLSLCLLIACCYPFADKVSPVGAKPRPPTFTLRWPIGTLRNVSSPLAVPPSLDRPRPGSLLRAHAPLASRIRPA
jgi:hypothetical protein